MVVSSSQWPVTSDSVCVRYLAITPEAAQLLVGLLFFSHSSHLTGHCRRHWSPLRLSGSHSPSHTHHVPVHCTSQPVNTWVTLRLLQTAGHKYYCSIGPSHTLVLIIFITTLSTLLACHWEVCDCYRFVSFLSFISLSVNLILAHVTSTLSSSNWQSAPLVF